MAKLGPNEREGYKKVEIVEGYDMWAPTYDGEHNPLIGIEESITLDLIGMQEINEYLTLVAALDVTVSYWPKEGQK